MINGSIPPDVDGINDKRAAWAKASLHTFMRATGCDYGDSLGNFLCDLMHLADRDGFDFELALNRARGHYAAETGAAPY